VKLESRSVDDIHQAACAEFEAAGDKEALRVLNSFYEATKAHFIEWIRLLRQRQERKQKGIGE
jgi:hypothetical protein